jgi:hypothetical protein
VAEDYEEKRRMRFREFLWLQHSQKTKYAEVAGLILGGGPGSVWAGKPLNARAVLADIEGFFAGEVGGITEVHVQQIRDAVDDYLEDPPLVDDLVEARLQSKTTLSPVRAALEGTNSGHYYETQGSKTAPGTMVPIIKCTWSQEFPRIDDMGKTRIVVKHCTIDSVPGLDRCEIHGGSLVDENELQNHLKVAAIRLVEHSHRAVDTLADLMVNSVDDSVKLRAAEAMLDRAGFKPGVDVHIHTGATQDDVYDPTKSSAAAEIRERIMELAAGRVPPPEPEPEVEEDPDLIEGEVVDDAE